jgi:hypothetical protein
MYLYVQLVGLEQELGEHGRGSSGLVEFDENTERQGIVDNGLAHVENSHAVFGENFRESVGETGAIRAGDLDKKDASVRRKWH